MTKTAKDHDRARAMGRPTDAEGDVDMEEEQNLEDGGSNLAGQDALGSKVIVIHVGSQNMRIGLASDALPKTVPMVVAKRSEKCESEEADGQPRPKRLKMDDGELKEPEKMFGDEFAVQYTSMSADLKVHMRNNKRRVLPNSKEMVVNYNRRTPPETISEHNFFNVIEWTEIYTKPSQAPDYVTGKEALRIPDTSTPRYRLHWPIRQGWCNEEDYKSRRTLFQDIALIISDAVKTQLGLALMTRREWSQYGCVFVIPDLYEKVYVTHILEMIIRDFGFGRVCFIQESLAASFGAGFTTTCIVDVGAQKTSICCVEEGMCVDNSRVNLKYGGADVTEAFVKMMLFDHFPYADINLKRRYDLILADELKQKFCTMNEAEVSVQLYDFHVRAPGQDTRKFTFKCYDEVLLAAMGFFKPAIFENTGKLNARRKLLDRSYDLYDGAPNDPISMAQSEILQAVAPPLPEGEEATVNGKSPERNGYFNHVKPAPINPLSRFHEREEATPRSSIAGSPPPGAGETPQPGGFGTPAAEGVGNGSVTAPAAPMIEERDDILPVFPLDKAIMTSIRMAARSDERKLRDFLGGIMVVGGGSQVPGFYSFLEAKMHAINPTYSKEILIGTPPRELDPQVVVWKGGSVFGKLQVTNDSWIGQMEYDRLGSRLLAYKCMWAW